MKIQPTCDQNLANFWSKPSQLLLKHKRSFMNTWRASDENLMNLWWKPSQLSWKPGELQADSRDGAGPLARLPSGPCVCTSPMISCSILKEMNTFCYVLVVVCVVIFKWESTTTWALPSSSVFCASPKPLSGRRRRLLAGVVTPGACRPVVVVFFWPVVFSSSAGADGLLFMYFLFISSRTSILSSPPVENRKHTTLHRYMQRRAIAKMCNYRHVLHQSR